MSDRPTPDYLQAVVPPTEAVELTPLEQVLLALDKATEVLVKVNANLILVKAAQDANTAAIRALEARVTSMELEIRSASVVNEASSNHLKTLTTAILKVLSK